MLSSKVAYCAGQPHQSADPSAQYRPPDMNIIARLFFVDAIDLLEAGDTTKETGNRLRIDWNVSF